MAYNSLKELVQVLAVQGDLKPFIRPVKDKLEVDGTADRLEARHLRGQEATQ